MEGYLREVLAELLECPICNEVMAEVMLCRTGHSFCRTCGKALERCAFCRSPMFIIKKYPAFEALVKQFFPKENCQIEYNNSETQTIATADFPGESPQFQDTSRAPRCPFQGCDKISVGLRGLSIHLARSHSILQIKVKKSSSDCDTATVPLPLILLTQKNCKVVKCFGQLFVVNFDVDADNLLMSVLVSGLNTKVVPGKFAFNVLENTTDSFSEVMPYLVNMSADRWLMVPLVKNRMNQNYQLRIKRLRPEDQGMT